MTSKAERMQSELAVTLSEWQLIATSTAPINHGKATAAIQELYDRTVSYIKNPDKSRKHDHEWKLSRKPKVTFLPGPLALEKKLVKRDDDLFGLFGPEHTGYATAEWFGLIEEALPSEEHQSRDELMWCCVEPHNRMISNGDRSSSSKLNIAPQMWGGQDAFLAAGVEYYRQFFDFNKTAIDNMMAWVQVCRQNFWWYPYQDEVFVIERPTILRFDPFHRMHNDAGPAFAFKDGHKGYYWCNVQLTEEIVEGRDRITVDQIMKEANAERRRAMMGLYGLERMLVDLNAKLIQSDGYGDLYEVVIDNERQRFVKVVNGTPNPDGSYKDYIIPVRREMETAHQAVAATFHLTPETYAPEIRT